MVTLKKNGQFFKLALLNAMHNYFVGYFHVVLFIFTMITGVDANGYKQNAKKY